MVESRSSFTNTTEMLMKVESASAGSTSPSKTWFSPLLHHRIEGSTVRKTMPGGHLSGRHYVPTGSVEILRHNFFSV